MHPARALFLWYIVPLFLVCFATIYLTRQPTCALDLASPIGRIIHELKPVSAVLCEAFALISFAAAASIMMLRDFSRSSQPQTDSSPPSSDVADSLEGHPDPNPESETKPWVSQMFPTKILPLFVLVYVGTVYVGSFAALCAVQSFKEGVAWPQNGQIPAAILAGLIYESRGVGNCGIILGVGYGLYVGVKHTIGVVRRLRRPEIAETTFTLREGADKD